MSFAEMMLDMLTSAYDRSDLSRLRAGKGPGTNVGRLACLVGWGSDIIRDQAEKVRLWDDIDRMEGTTLDRCGKDFGVGRGEASDAIFRVMIKVKILAMLAAGDLDTLILAASSLFGVAAEDVKSQEVYPAKVYLYIDEDKLDREHRDIAGIIAGLMSRIKSACVGIRIFYRTYSQKGARVHVGASTCLASFVDVPTMPMDMETVKSVDMRAGVGTLIYTTVSYPVGE